MKIVFLDFDGPIIPEMSHLERRLIKEKAWPACVTALNRITDTTAAKIVISSSWRWGGDPDAKTLLGLWGVTAEVIGQTPILESSWKPDKQWTGVPRGCEIAAWLAGKSDIESFVILDDDDDMEELKPFLILTPFSTGLTEALADEAIAMLDCSIAEVAER